MKKSDLKPGMVVENRIGVFYILRKIKDKIILSREEGWDDLHNFDNNLENCKSESLDIVKIYESCGEALNSLFEKRNLILLWERQRNKVSFQEAFKAYEEGKEIESCVSGCKYRKDDKKDYYKEIDDCNWQVWLLGGGFDFEEIRGEWYIN